MDFLYELNPIIVILIYLVLSVCVVYSSKKISDCVDNLDKLTNIGGALIGGVFLAAVTSLPELITSISSSVMGEPGLVFGNILGSNLFNILILAVVDIIFINHMFMNKIKTLRKTNLFTIIMYVVVLVPLAIYQFFDFNVFKYLNIHLFNFINLSVISLIIIVIYGFSIKALATDQVKEDDSEETKVIEDEKAHKQKIRNEIFKFLGFAVLLVGFSILLTMTVDCLADQLDLGKSVAGALFLGAATSLPEMTAVIQLVRLKNYDAACGNVIGSNVFNFTILSVVDIIYGKEDIFLSRLPIAKDSILYAESINVRFLALFGIIAAGIAMYMILRKNSKNKITYIIPSVIIVFVYAAYLLTSFLIK